MIFQHRLGSWDLTRSARVVGILNVTPDSFSDGGRFVSPEEAVGHAERMTAEGADAIDIGGQTTRPGAGEPVGPEEEWRRIGRVIAVLTDRIRVPVSVDTYWGEVARRALDQGAAIVNDVSGLGVSPEIAELVATAGAGLVLMHSMGAPNRLHQPRQYEDVTREVRDFLEERLRMAKEHGVPAERIALDPGIGFSKRAEQSLETLRGLPCLTSLGRPLYIGVSRKSFLGAVTDRPVEDRLAAGLAATVAAFSLGGRIFRTHDVRETVDALKVAEKVL